MGHDPIATGCNVPFVPYGKDFPEGVTCHYCGTNVARTRDHVVARSKLGSDAYWNLVPACKTCNGNKADKDTWCQCAFCTRAVLLFSLGHTRHKSGGRRPFYKTDEEQPSRKRSRSSKKKPKQFWIKASPLPDDLSHEAYLQRQPGYVPPTSFDGSV
jgi:hypothetical protein